MTKAAKANTFWLETLGCAKNQVDSDKLAGLLANDGYVPAQRPDNADLLVVNTCAFIEAAREESIGAVLQLAGSKKRDARLTVTGCMAERYGQELADALPEVDLVAGFGTPVQFARNRLEASGERPLPSFDLLNLPRPPARAPWAYVKVAEGCDRHCGFCAIPSFRGRQRSRSTNDILAEVETLDVAEVVLVAQDLVSWNRDIGARLNGGTATAGPETAPDLVALVQAVSQLVERVRLLYLYPSGLTRSLIDAMGASGCPYFDLSLQHASAPLLRRMRRFGDGEKFLRKIELIRHRFPEAALRSSFIVGYPGETEEDHDALLTFLQQAQLDWVGFFAFSPEEGTYAAALPGQVPSSLAAERLRECSEVQDAITASKRLSLVGTTCRALVDATGVARSHREAPEIDGVIRVPRHLPAGSWVQLDVVEAIGPDLVGRPSVRDKVAV
ncbi:MAG TPA: MiaB/RimO family radical SAM methylthiotransferase [Acidimicrobiales bacterium]|nr:MiaB/RimO family radical SAM methylthiotransferase [Acidimicrobiales bacterium]